MPLGDRPADEAYSLVCPFDGLFLTATGGLLGMIDLQGVDPDSLTKDDALRLAQLTADIYGAVPPFVSVTQYYAHAEGARVTLRDRPGNPVANTLVKAREAALNARGLASSRLVHVFHYRDPLGWNDPFMTVMLRNLPLACFDRNAREVLKARFSAPHDLVLREQELRQRAQQLHRAMADVAQKWGKVMGAEVMAPAEAWRFAKYLATLDPLYLDTNRPIAVPPDDLDVASPNGDIEPVSVDYVDMLKIHGPVPRYARLAAVIKTHFNPVGLWSVGTDAPVRGRGNFVHMTHFTPLSAFERSWTFRAARNRLERTRLDIKKILYGDQEEERDTSQDRLVIKRKREELEKAEAIEDRFGTFTSQVCLYDTSPVRLARQSEEMHTTLTARGMELVWESAGLPTAYKVLQPGGQAHSVRHAIVTESRAAAMSLVSKSATGPATVKDLDGEEPLYVFETEEGQPFWFSPYVGGRAFCIAVGPTRSGKTFLKNTISAHALKYGGFVRMLDIDPGSETLARFYGDQAGTVRLGGQGDRARSGVNPFAGAAGPGDTAFVAHMLALVQELLAANDTEEARRLERHEQQEVDRAVLDTLRLPPEMQTLEHMLSHLPRATGSKFSRWRQAGAYDGIFNAAVDGIGRMDRPLGVINLQDFRDDPKVLRALYLDLFFRMTRLFEDPAHKGVPKTLDIDEAHHPLGMESFRTFLLKKVRTWAKHNASITLWSQGPADYLNIGGDTHKDAWDLVRGSASTFIFLADGQMDAELYRRTFSLTDGQLAAIRQLTPRREAFILQPEAGVSKKVILRVEPEQQLVNTSHPQEVLLRDRLVAEHGFEEGMRLALAELAPRWGHAGRPAQPVRLAAE
jgi:type IV secretion system protein VirB4